MKYQQPYYNQNIQKPKKPNSNYYYSYSIPQLLSWASQLLDLDITSIDQTCTGAIFCQLLDACYPGSVNLSKVNWKANCESDFISNFKIFQQGLNKNNIDKTININRLAKGKQYDLNELLQWICGHYFNNKNNKNNVKESYNAKKKRNGQKLVFINNKIIKKKKNKFIKDNLSQISSSSCNSSIKSDSCIQPNSFNNYYHKGDKNNFNYNRSKDNIGFNNNNLRNKYNMSNNCFYDEQNNSNNRIRNLSKRELIKERQHEFEEKVSNDKYYSAQKNLVSQSKRNIDYNFHSSQKSNYFNFNRNNSSKKKFHQKNNNIYKINKIDLIDNNINYNNNNIRRKFPNILDVNYDLSSKNRNNGINQFTEEEEESSQIIIDNDMNNADEDDDNDKEIDMTDFNGLNNEELKYLKMEENKDGNKVKDLKRTIRKLRISNLFKEKEIENLKNILNNINKLKIFYLNKLKDIEYLYFNPKIKNSNENKNNILWQILSSQEDSSIFLDEDYYAFIPNKKNGNPNSNIMSYHKMRSEPQSSKKKGTNGNISNNISDGRLIMNNTYDYNGQSMDNINYSSKKNYNQNYLNNIFDSFEKKENEIMSFNKKNNMNNSNNYQNNYNNINNNNIIINSYNEGTNNQNTNTSKNEFDILSNFNNSNYNNTEKLNGRTQKIIPFKLSNSKANTIIYSNNINNNDVNNISNFITSQNITNCNSINDTYISNQKENFDLNYQTNYTKNNNCENEGCGIKNLDKYNKVRSLQCSKKKIKGENSNENETKKSFQKLDKSQNIFSDICTQLLNDSLNLKCLNE